MIKYYSPHLSLRVIFNPKDGEQFVIDYFKKHTGKNYILLTSSCRSALYLTYKALGVEGEVLTTPLTCEVGILPIIHSGNKPVFIDINKSTLNIDETLIPSNINKSTIALQLIHIRINPFKIKKKKKNIPDNIVLIEDCAQAFGAKFNNKNMGTYGDVSCFSLTKNLFGIAGGVLATNNYEIYHKARLIQNKFPLVSSKFLYYRIVRNYLETKKHLSFYNFLYKLLFKIKSKSTATKANEFLYPVKNYLVRPKQIIFRISSFQLKKSNYFLSKRKKIAHGLIEKIALIPNVQVQKLIVKNAENAYCKLYIYSPLFTKNTILELNQNGIEAKHLEQDYEKYFQEKFTTKKEYQKYESLQKCNNYNILHDKIISLPLHESLTPKEIDKVIRILQEMNNSKKHA